jgi:hypothetical protein
MDEKARFKAGFSMLDGQLQPARDYYFLETTIDVVSKSQVVAVFPSSRSKYFNTRPWGFFGKLLRNSI